MNKLSDAIVSDLAKKIGKAESTVKKDIYSLRKSYPQCTANAVAQIYAQSYGKTVFRKLDQEDKQSLPSNSIAHAPVVIKKKSTRTTKKTEKKIVKFIEYSTDDNFRKGHIDEINKAYTYGCYTSVFILLRKVVENMLIDILRHKFPSGASKENKELFYDIKNKRIKNFSAILVNFRGKSSEFDEDKKLVERIAELAKVLKDDSNDKAHSWFHLVTNKAEIDSLNPQQIIDMIATLENNIGMK